MLCEEVWHNIPRLSLHTMLPNVYQPNWNRIIGNLSNQTELYEPPQRYDTGIVKTLCNLNKILLENDNLLLNFIMRVQQLLNSREFTKLAQYYYFF